MPNLLFARQSAGTPEDAEFSNERLVNLYVRAFPDAGLAPALIKQTDGLVSFADLGTDQPVRAAIVSGSLVYAISGGKLFSVSSAGSVVELDDTLTDALNTSVFDNDNGEIGIAAGGVYSVWDIAGGTMSTPSMNALTGPQHVAYLDGYGILADTATDRFQTTDASDATTLNALSFSSADYLNDGIVSLIAYQSYLWILGERTTEIWRNTGASATFPFQRVSGGILQRGCFGAKTVAADDQSVFYVGDDRSVYRILESSPTRISTHAVERRLRNYQDGSELTGFTWTEDGHKFYALRFPDAPAYVYDMSTGVWHERSSDVFGEAAWTAYTAIRAFGYELIGSSDGMLYRLDPTAYDEAGTAICRIAESSPVSEGDMRTNLDRVSINVKTGYVDIGREPQIALQVSRDGKLYTPEKFRGMSDLGDYSRVLSWHGMGRARRHQAKFKTTDPVPISIYGATYALSP